MNELIYEELLEATYGFCLKQVNDPNDAEDLTQEILLEAFSARNKNIENFYAWFWKMAKNRVNRFYRLKKNGAVLLDEYVNVPSEPTELDSEMLKSEELNELNYHISRLSELHRNVIIMYYLREMSVSDIAKELGVPEGTVKRRLFDARNDIKKGMEDMTNHGRASYAPAEVVLWGGYGIPDYWNKIDRKIEKQIFACCAFEPKTVKEIADEIGCAPVYFEENLQELVNCKFVKEVTKGKYIIDFCLLPAQAYADSRYEISLAYKDLGREITELIKSKESELRAVDFYGNDMPFGELLWFMYYIFAAALQNNMNKLNSHLWEGKVAPNNGKKYRLAGTLRLPDENIEQRESGVPCVGWSNLHCNFMTSSYRWMQYGNIFQAAPFGNRDGVFGESTADLFMRIFDEPKLELTENEKYKAASLIEAGFLKEKDGGLYPTMPIMTWATYLKLVALAEEYSLELAKKYCDKVNEISARLLLPHIRKDMLEEYAHWILSGNFFPIAYFYGYAVNNPAESGITLPEDYNNTALATYVTYNK